MLILKFNGIFDKSNVYYALILRISVKCRYDPILLFYFPNKDYNLLIANKILLKTDK